MNRLKIICSAMLISTVLASCSATIDVPALDQKTDENIAKVPGKYTAYIQTGGWKMNAKTRQWGCSAWTVELNLNEIYLSGLKHALEANLQSVTFSEKPVASSDLSELGFDRQILVQQGNADATFSHRVQGLKMFLMADVRLTAITAISGSDTEMVQDTITGRGHGGASSWSCLNDKPYVAASSLAVQSTIRRVVSKVRDRLSAP